MKNIYLCLSLGWTQFEEEYGPREGRLKISAVSNHYANMLLSKRSDFNTGDITLKAKNTLGKGYEAGSVLSKKYEVQSIDEGMLSDDLTSLIKHYLDLKGMVGSSVLNIEIDSSKYDLSLKEFQKEVAKESFAEDREASIGRLLKKVVHKAPEIREKFVRQIIRNRVNSEFIKSRANYICELCGEKPFMQKNSKPYAEADHVVPLGGGSEGLDSPDNMRCLCARCHAIITHGSELEIKKLLTTGGSA